MDLGRRLELCPVGPGTLLDTEDEINPVWTVVVSGCALATRRGVPLGLVTAGDRMGARRGQPPTQSRHGRALDAMVVLMAERRAVPSMAQRHPGVAERLAAAAVDDRSAAADAPAASPTVGGSVDRGCDLTARRPALSLRGDHV